MFGDGFLGTRALWFMDVTTIWFALLPTLMAYAIYLATKNKIVAHKRLNTLLFAATIVMVLVFEIGVRFSGGYMAYAQDSGVSFALLTTILIVHIIIAVASVVLWAYLLVGAHQSYALSSKVPMTHKLYGKIVFIGMSVTSLLGILIYFLLFV